MKKDIHPKYYPDAKISCACGNSWTVGATVAEIRIDVCSQCHPFFTGEQRIIDTAGQVERFRRRLAKAVQGQEAAVEEKPTESALPTPGSRIRDKAKSQDA